MQQLDRDDVREAARQALGRRSLEDFNARVDPDYDTTLAHSKIINEYLDALAAREIIGLMVFMPPQCGKSTLVSQRFPAYMLGKSGGKTLVATASYSIDIARKNSRASRSLLIDRERWPFPDVNLDPEAQSVDEWYTTAKGSVKAVGAGGSLTGFGANCIIIDDPLKGMAEADSLVISDKTWEWYQTTVSTRQRANVQKCLVQTRWRDNDLAGRILNTPAAKDWTILTLRAFAEEDDPLHRPLGAVLWPGGPRPLDPAQGEISSRAFSALYQQRPLPAEGALFKAEWFANRYDDLPDMNRVVIAIDGAFKQGVQNDFSAIAVWGASDTGEYLINAWHGRLEYPELKQKSPRRVRSVQGRVRRSPGAMRRRLRRAVWRSFKS